MEKHIGFFSLSNSFNTCCNVLLKPFLHNNYSLFCFKQSVMQYPILILAVMLSCICNTTYSQGRFPPPAYDGNIKTADSLLKKGNYALASEHYRKAFAAFDGAAAPGDRLNSARAFAFSGKKDAAIAALQKYCTNNRHWEYTQIYNDPAFYSIRSTPEFTSVIDCMKANKQKYAPNFNYEWQHVLDSIHTADQVVRKKDTTILKDPIAMAKANERMQKVDSSNLVFVSGFLDKYGWKGANEVGETGNNTLFLVIQHAPLAVQEKYLPLLRKAVKEGKAWPNQLALLEDRVLVAQKGYQIYGSQLHMDEHGVMTVSPIQDEANVNKRRAAVGLEPLEEYLKYFNINYTPKK